MTGGLAIFLGMSIAMLTLPGGLTGYGIYLAGAAVLTLVLFFAISSLHDLGVWDEFWEEIKKR